MARFTIKKKDLVNYVEVELNNDSIRTESGMLHYYRGNIEMKTPMPSIGGFFKSKLSGENVFRPVYSGTGTVVLEPSFNEFFAFPLDGEPYIIDRGAYVASDDEVEVTVKVNKITAALFSGEGLIQTMVKGKGIVVLKAQGPIEVIDLVNDKLVVDGNFAVARSAGLNFSVQTSTRSLFGTIASSELLVQVLQGTGRVYLAPIPNYPALLQNVVGDTVFNSMAALTVKK